MKNAINATAARIWRRRNKNGRKEVTDVRNTARLLVLAMLASPAFSPAAQKKDDIVSIQRDIADLADKLTRLQKSQDEKMQAITALVQQSMEASAKVSGSLSALQNTLTNNVSQSLAEQQKRAAEQHAEMGVKLDSVSRDMGAMSETVSQLSKRLADMDSKLSNLNELVKTLNTPPALPVPAAPQNSSGAPVGWVAGTAYNSARLDYTGGRYDLAIQGFLDYVKYAPKDDENAPNAQYFIGMSYFMLKQYDSAAQAFSDVVDKYQPNPKSCDSRYMKGMALQKTANKADALSAYHDFMNACPADPNRESAREHIAELSGPARANIKGKGKAK
jgi:TolA-binding protein